jgi:hypothetical protein
MLFDLDVAARNAAAYDRVARSGFRDPVARALGSFARDAGGGALAYADPEAKALEVDAKAARARFVVSTPTKDRHGDWVVPEGCKGRLDRFQKNPGVFFGHKSNGLPIGSARHKDGSLAVEVRDGLGVISDCYFHLKTRESEDVFRLVEADELRAASIGFIPLKGKAVENDPAKSDDKDAVDFGSWLSFVFEEWELLEWSVVPIPANPECIALRLERGFGGKALSESVQKALRPYAAELRAWSPGFGPGERKSDIPPPADPPPGYGEDDDAKKKKPKAPHGALTLARLVRRLSESVAFCKAEEPAFDNASVKNWVCGAAESLERLRDDAIAFALAQYPDVDFAALEVEVPVRREKKEAPAPVTQVPEPGLVVESAGGLSPAQVDALAAAVRELRADQKSAKDELRRVTGKVD